MKTRHVCVPMDLADWVLPPLVLTALPARCTGGSGDRGLEVCLGDCPWEYDALLEGLDWYCLKKNKKIKIKIRITGCNPKARPHRMNSRDVKRNHTRKKPLSRAFLLPRARIGNSLTERQLPRRSPTTLSTIQQHITTSYEHRMILAWIISAAWTTNRERVLRAMLIAK